VVANAIRPPSGFGRNKRNELPPLVGRHIVARVCTDHNISGAGIEIDDRPEQERFARPRWTH
jgi:hypothetical protein